MIEVGAKLGGKYFVTERQDRIVVGARFEVRTSQGVVRWAQWLHDGALNAGQVAQLQAELAAIPAHPLFRAVEEVVTSPRGIPAAIYSQPLPKPISHVTAGLSVASQESRRLPALRALFGWIAALADALNVLHAARATHGDISLPHLGAVGDGESAQVVLSGFGVEPARRAARAGATPTPRGDLNALVLLLHRLMEQLGAQLTGAALVRWDVLRNCARAGDHTALSSGSILAKSLRDLLHDEEAMHRAKTAVPKSPPAGATPSSPAAASPGADPRRRRVILKGALALVATAALAATIGAYGRSVASRGGRSQTALAAANCGDEPMRPPVGVALAVAPASIEGACRDDGTLVVTARGADGLFAADRPARRGEAFRAAPARVTDNASEHSVLEEPQGPWVAWRQASGAAFGAARLRGEPEPRALSQGAWRAERFRGVWILRVEAETLWLASNLVTAGVERAVVLRLPSGSSEAPEAFGVGEGAVVAAIGGQPATLLMREGASLYALSVPTNALRVLASGQTAGDAGAASADAAVEASDVSVRTVPRESLRRSEPWRGGGRWVFAAPAGLAVPGGARLFAATRGDAALPEGCVGPPCAYRGEVFALSFVDRGPPQATRLASSGRASSITVGPDGTRWVAGVGAREEDLALWAVRADGVPVEHTLDGQGGPTSLTSCGDERWVAHAEPGPRPRLVASPLPCAVLAGR